MKAQINLTHHAVIRFNERIGSASLADITDELGRAKSKHLRKLDKVKNVKRTKTVYVPTPKAIFICAATRGVANVVTVLSRDVA
jgi:hypothetical protein